MNGTSANSLSLEDATIGVVTVLAEELAAACSLLGANAQRDTEGRIYRLGRVARFDRLDSHVIAVCQGSDMGTNTASARASLLLRDCPNVRLVIMCGIAGAVPNPSKAGAHVRVGDIVVVNRRGVVQYDFVKEHHDHTEFRERWAVPARVAVEAAQQLVLNQQMGERPWETYLEAAIETLTAKSGESWARPPESSDQLREFDHRTRGDYIKRCAHWLSATKLGRLLGITVSYPPIAHPVDELRQDGKPRVFHGVIASANNLQKNPRRRDFLRDKFGAMAVEMEGSGIGDAAYESDVGFFIVRGTCDYCNPEKNDEWHRYAAAAAAAYTRSLLEVVPVQRRLATPGGASIGTPSLGDVRSSGTSEGTEDLRGADAALPELRELAVGRAVAHALDDILRQQAASALQRSRSALESWEFDTAFFEASQLASVLEKYEPHFPADELRRLYEWLAQLEAIRAHRGQDRDAALERADLFLAKAKNAS